MPNQNSVSQICGELPEQVNDMIVKTQSGSIYEIDFVKMTWTRIVQGDQSNAIRTAAGDLITTPQVVIGQPMILLGSPIVEGCVARAIATSEVVEII